MTGAEHLAWCKERALEYAERGEFGNALTSMASDLGKHPHTNTESLARLTRLGLQLLLIGELSTIEDMRRFIKGFN